MKGKTLIFSAIIMLVAVFIRFYDNNGKSVMTFSQNGDEDAKNITLEDLANSLYHGGKD